MATETLGTGASNVTGTAPDINGRPAKWLADGLEWEYVNGGWASLLDGGGGVKVMLPLFEFLGTNPANWTTSPIAN